MIPLLYAVTLAVQLKIQSNPGQLEFKLYVITTAL